MSGEFKHYDEQFTLAGVPYQFMLARPGTLSNVSSSPFAPKSVFGDRTYADYDAISAVALTDFTGGMGQERQTDATMFYDAEDIDTRGGRILLGPTAHLLSLPAGERGLAMQRASWGAITSPLQPRLARRFVTRTDETLLQRIWLPIVADKGAGTLTVKLCADTAGAPGAVLATTTVAASRFTGYGQWLDAVFAPAAAVTANAPYWLTLEQSAIEPVFWVTALIQAPSSSYSWNGTGWTQEIGRDYALMYDDPRVRPDSTPQVISGAGADQIARIWFTAGRVLFYVGSSDTATPVKTAADNATIYQTAADIAARAWFDSPADAAPWLYLALGDTTDMVRFNASIGAEAWETLTGHKARRLANHDNLLVYAYDRNKLDCYNGTQWGGSNASYVEVGDRTYPIRALVSWNGAVWVGKDDGLFKVTVPTGYPVTGSLACQKIIDFTPLANNVNFSFLVNHQGDLYFNINNGIMRFTAGSVLQSIGPDTALNVSANKRYHYRAAVSVFSTLWVLGEPGFGGVAKLLAYIEGHWHPVSGFSDQPMRSICLEPGWYGNLPRLWFSLGLSPAYIQMPTTTMRRWLWDDADYALNGEFFSSWIDGNIRTIEKDWLAVELDAVNLDAANFVTLYWQADETAMWQLIGSAITNGITTLRLPAGSHSGRCRLKVVITRAANSAVSPRIEALVLKYMERPEDVRSHTRAYRLADRLENRNGVVVTRSLAEQLADLRTLREAKEPLTWRAWYGTEYQAHIVNFSVTEMPDEARAAGDKGAMLVIVNLQEV